MESLTEFAPWIESVSSIAGRVAGVAVRHGGLKQRIDSTVEEDATISSRDFKLQVMVSYVEQWKSRWVSNPTSSHLEPCRSVCSLMAGRDHSEAAKILMFNGKSPYSWIMIIERFFHVCQVSEAERLSWMYVCFEGDALFWYKRELASRAFLNWCELKNLLLARFARVKSSSKTQVKLQKELIFQIDEETNSNCANISVATETTPEQDVIRKEEAIPQTESFSQEVSIPILEFGHHDQMLGDFGVSDISVPEVSSPILVELHSEVAETGEQSTYVQSSLSAYKVFDRMFLRGDLIANLDIVATTSVGVNIGQGLRDVYIQKATKVENLLVGQLAESKVLKGVRFFYIKFARRNFGIYAGDETKHSFDPGGFRYCEEELITHTSHVSVAKEEEITSRISDATTLGESLAVGNDMKRVWEKLLNTLIVYLGEAEHVLSRRGANHVEYDSRGTRLPARVSRKLTKKNYLVALLGPARDTMFSVFGICAGNKRPFDLGSVIWIWDCGGFQVIITTIRGTQEGIVEVVLRSLVCLSSPNRSLEAEPKQKLQTTHLIPDINELSLVFSCDLLVAHQEEQPYELLVEMIDLPLPSITFSCHDFFVHMEAPRSFLFVEEVIGLFQSLTGMHVNCFVLSEHEDILSTPTKLKCYKSWHFKFKTMSGSRNKVGTMQFVVSWRFVWCRMFGWYQLIEEENAIYVAATVLLESELVQWIVASSVIDGSAIGNKVAAAVFLSVQNFMSTTFIMWLIRYLSSVTQRMDNHTNIFKFPFGYGGVVVVVETIITGKTDVKVQAMEAAEAFKRIAEQKQNEHLLKKAARKLERARLEQKNLRKQEMAKDKMQNVLGLMAARMRHNSTLFFPELQPALQKRDLLLSQVHHQLPKAQYILQKTTSFSSIEMEYTGVTKIDKGSLLIQLTRCLPRLQLHMAHKAVKTGRHQFFAIWHRWRIRDLHSVCLLHNGAGVSLLELTRWSILAILFIVEHDTSASTTASSFSA